MVNQIINATYTETYDLNTAVNEMTLLGIHTPLAKNLKAQFKGFFQQYKKIKVNSCDIALACASQQSLDPTQLGIESGAMDPRDVMNPILFKACTGEKLNVLLDQIYSPDENQYTTDKGSIRQVFDNKSASLAAYYSLLSDDSFRKTHPQNGLTVMGLKPLVRKIVTTGEFKYAGENENQLLARPALQGENVYGFGSDATRPNDGRAINIPNVFMTNGTTDLPAVDTIFEANAEFENSQGGTDVVTKHFLINNIPRVYCGVIVLPPAIVQRLFFRMTIRWHISFFGFRPSIDLAALDSYENIDGGEQGMNDNALYGYYNVYHNATPNSKEMSRDYASFSTNEKTEVIKILEKGA